MITGASRGIGRAVAIAAAVAGAELIITGRTIGALEEVDDEIRAAGSKATIVEMDMKDTNAAARLAAAINQRWLCSECRNASSPNPGCTPTSRCLG